MSGQWEYMTFQVVHDQTRKSWVMKLADGTQLDGWSEIFSFYGKQGWEFFSVVIEAQSQNYDGAGSGNVAVYRLFGKRAK
jgi:hypothetical protein